MYKKLNEHIMHTTALFDKAAEVLENKLAQDANNPQLLAALLNNARQRGQIQAAKTYCERLLVVAPEHTQARCLSAIFNEQPLKLQPNITQPVPYIRRKGILNAAEQQQIWDCIEKKKADFEPSKLITGYTSDIRQSQLITAKKKTLLHTIKAWFVPKVEHIIQDKLACFDLADTLIGKKELQLTLHGDTDYLKTHTDVLLTKPTDQLSAGYQVIQTRKISFVYYFHSEPQQFTGGELLLLDTQLAQDTYSPEHTRIQPEHNSLVLFPSQFYHQVTPVACKADPYQHGRFTLNGWIHERVKE